MKNQTALSRLIAAALAAAAMAPVAAQADEGNFLVRARAVVLPQPTTARMC